EPKLFTSLTSLAYLALPSEGGPSGRKNELVGMANGATNPHCGNRYGANAGGVGTHAPGSVPGGGETIALEGSPCRDSKSWAATDSPHSMPLVLDGPSAIRASVAP